MVQKDCSFPAILVTWQLLASVSDESKLLVPETCKLETHSYVRRDAHARLNLRSRGLVKTHEDQERYKFLQHHSDPTGCGTKMKCTDAQLLFLNLVFLQWFGTMLCIP